MYLVFKRWLDVHLLISSVSYVQKGKQYNGTKRSVIPVITFQESHIILLVTSACTFHTEGISWHFLELVVYYDTENNVIIHNDFTKLFEFYVEENEMGWLSQYSDSLQDEWQMLDSQKEQEFFSSKTASVV